MPTSQAAQSLAASDIPAFAAKWKAWAQQQIDAAAATSTATITSLQGQVADLQAQLDKANAGLTQTVADQGDDVAALQAALAANGPPAN